MNTYQENELRQKLADATHNANMLFIPTVCAEGVAIFLKVAGELGPANAFMLVAAIPASFAGLEFVRGRRIDKELNGAKKRK